MGTSKNLMKINLKDALPTGTHVRGNVYQLMADVIDMKLRGFCGTITEIWKESGQPSVNEKHIIEAAFYTHILPKFQEGPCDVCLESREENQ